MLTREITFYCQREMSSAHAKQLKRLATMFNAYTCCANLTRRHKVTPSNQLSLLTLATQPGDLCQLQFHGSDAELAHMAFTCWCNELGLPLMGNKEIGIAEQRLAKLHPDYHFALSQLAQWSEPINKSQALMGLLDLLPTKIVRNRAQLDDAITAREQISATIIRHGLAIPHVLSSGITQPAITFLQNKAEIEWGVPTMTVTNMILLAAPHPSPPETLRPLTRLVQAMCDEIIAPALFYASSPQARQAIIIEGLLS